jgi:hypothetical protein
MEKARACGMGRKGSERKLMDEEADGDESVGCLRMKIRWSR